MKTHLNIVITGIFIVILSGISLADEYNFRKTKWGMSIKQVKLSETSELLQENENSLVFKTSVLANDVMLGYVFAENKLVGAHYILLESHTNISDFIKDYNSLKEMLTKKYGKPKYDHTVWNNELFKDDPSSWGMALSVGHLAYVSTWETEDTVINNVLWGDNYEITCGVQYESKKLIGILDKSKEKKSLDAF
jgi:hypothetical protein